MKQDNMQLHLSPPTGGSDLEVQWLVLLIGPSESRGAQVSSIVMHLAALPRDAGKGTGVREARSPSEAHADSRFQMRSGKSMMMATLASTGVLVRLHGVS